MKNSAFLYDDRLIIINLYFMCVLRAAMIHQYLLFRCYYHGPQRKSRQRLISDCTARELPVNSKSEHTRLHHVDKTPVQKYSTENIHSESRFPRDRIACRYIAVSNSCTLVIFYYTSNTRVLSMFS